MPLSSGKHDHRSADDFRRLRFFRDLVEVLSKEGRTLQAAALEMSRLGWKGGAARISRELSALEKRIGAEPGSGKLIQRTPGGREAKVTLAGQQLYERILMVEDSLRNCLRLTAKPPPIVIGLTTTVSTLYFPPVLVRSNWLATYPDIEITVREYEWPQLTHELARGTVDFAVGPVLPDNERFERRLLCRVKRVLLFPQKDPQFSRLQDGAIGWKQLSTALAGKTMFTLPLGAQPHQDLGLLFERVPTLRKVELPSQVEIIAYVRHGLGVGITTARFAQPWEGAARLSSLDVSHLVGTTEVYLYIPLKKKPALPEPINVLINAFKVYPGDPQELHTDTKA